MNRNKRLTRWFLTIVLSLVLIFSLTACADMGEFNSDDEDYSKFYESFGDIKGLYQGGDHSYDIETSLFNEYTVLNLDWEDEDDKVESEEYLYLIIPFDAELKFDAFILYMLSDTEVDVTISAYYFANSSLLPEKIKYKDSPETETKTVIIDDQEVEIEVKIDYDDPVWNDRVAEAYCHLDANKWGSFLMDGFTTEAGDGHLHTTEDGVLYVRIENNSGLNKEMKRFKFSFINFIARAVE